MKSFFNKYKFYLIGVASVLIIIAMGVSFAIFRISVTGNQSKLRAGSLILNLDESTTDGISINPAYPLTDEEGKNTKSYIFTLENNGTMDADYTIYLEDITTATNKMAHSIIRFNLKKQLYDSTGTLKGSQPSDKLDSLTNITNEKGEIVLDGGTMASGEKTTYTLNIWMDYNAGNEYQGTSFKGKLRIDGSQQYNKVSAAYTYDQNNAATLCITGEESTCVQTDCYESGKTCNPGDIIYYMVNPTTRVRFHVMYDENGKITMQSQKNTVSNIAWNTSGNNGDGPITILTALENATSTWTNVNDLTYTLGTTVFKTNAYTGCSTYNTCETNTYTLTSRTAKARMITVQEAALLGCTQDLESCPKWMNNYLDSSANYGYWTVSSVSSTSNNARVVYLSGALVYDANSSVNDTNYGARAIVQITK